jgi:hypothetical protein
MSSGEAAGHSAEPYDLTICTVSYQHAPHLRLNYELVRRLNPNTNIRWIVGENSPIGSLSRLVDGTMTGMKVLATEGLTPDGPKSNNRHTTALRACIGAVETRYFVVLDPDFYVGRYGWAADMMTYMRDKSLALLGAPWNPRHTGRYRYFPSVHCTMVDRAAFPPDRIYDPGVVTDRKHRVALKMQFRAPGVRVSRLRYRWRKFVARRLRVRWNQSWQIKDSGSALFGRYWAGEEIRAECLVPIFKPSDYRKLELLRGIRSRVLDAVLPEDYSFLPKRPQSYALTGGRVPKSEHTKDWEEFLWRNEYFGFHIRGAVHRRHRNASIEVENARTILDTLI